MHCPKMIHQHALSQKYSRYPHRNRPCHCWSECNGIPVVWFLGQIYEYVNISYTQAPDVTGSVFMGGFRLFLAQCAGSVHLNAMVSYDQGPWFEPRLLFYIGTECSTLRVYQADENFIISSTIFFNKQNVNKCKFRDLYHPERSHNKLL